MVKATKKILSISSGLLFLLALVAWARDSTGEMRTLALSPDGKLVAVAYVKGRDSFIYTITVATGKAARLTDAKTGEELSPAFSPDGKRIAFSYSPGNGAHSRIFIGNVNGSDLHGWAVSDADDFSPVFSPDNKTIIFSRSGYFGSYSPIAQPHQHDWSFFSSNLDGSNSRQLTNKHYFMVSAVSVSPDGKTMLFASSEERGDVIEVHSLEDSTKPPEVLRPPVPKGDNLGPGFATPAYLPDGKSILFMAASNGKHGYDYDVYRTELGTDSVERFTTGNGYATDLAVSADGKTAVFLKWQSDWRGTPDKNALYLLDLQTHKVTPITVSGLN
jgi:Tol biopolymer transport system component